MRRSPGRPTRDPTCGKHVVICELRARIHLKILVADIAAADEGDGVVDHEQLVVHAVVESAGIEQKLEGPNGTNMSAIGEWIEYAHFDGRMRIERSDLIITGDELEGPSVAMILAFRDRRKINSFL